MIRPTFTDFCELAEQGNLIPVYQELLMDLETPLSFFKRLERDRYAFLLESVEGSERWARYSFLGSRPRLVFKSRGKQVEIIEDGKSRKLDSEMPLDSLKELVGNYRPVTVPGVPPFFGGALGYVAYDAVEQFHGIGNNKKPPFDAPEIFFLFVQTLIAFDNLKHTIKIIDNVHLEPGIDLRSAYDQASGRIRETISSLQKKPRGIEPRELGDGRAQKKFRSNLNRDGFQNAVIKAKEYIQAGDIIQTVLSQRLETETVADAFEIYRALRFINPSPY
ncbi:MAG TPA: chorismate-binding protein, partial [Candidatus Binatia bacterium]